MTKATTAGVGNKQVTVNVGEIPELWCAVWWSELRECWCVNMLRQARKEAEADVDHIVNKTKYIAKLCRIVTVEGGTHGT